MPSHHDSGKCPDIKMALKTLRYPFKRIPVTLLVMTVEYK